jgi:hypothetical protein
VYPDVVDALFQIKLIQAADGEIIEDQEPDSEHVIRIENR